MALPPEIVEKRKNSLVIDLSEQYSRGQLTLEEYERLVEYTSKVETSRELALLSRMLRDNGSGPEGAREDRPEQAPPGFPAGSRCFAILSSRKFENLPPAREDRDFLSILGDCHVWVKEQDLDGEVTALNANTLLGSVMIHVPDNVEVENRVVPIMGDAGVKKRKRNRGSDSPWNKKLVITGTAILGTVTVVYGK